MAVVIDVLRATSTIVTALAAGAAEIRPAASPREARTRYARLAAARGSRDGLLLGGERLGLRIEGFDLGNSPLEYTPEAVGGRVVFFSTTNGTRTLRRAAGRRTSRAPRREPGAFPAAATSGPAREVLVASFLNAGAIVDRLWTGSGSIVMACAGTRGGFSLEDVLLAGLLVDGLERRAAEDAPAGPRGAVFAFRDLARAAATLYRSLAGPDGHDLAKVIVQADHARYLASIGFADDVAYCANRDLTSVVPVYAGGRVVVPPESGRTPTKTGTRPSTGRVARA